MTIPLFQKTMLSFIKGGAYFGTTRYSLHAASSSHCCLEPGALLHLCTKLTYIRIKLTRVCPKLTDVCTKLTDVCTKLTNVKHARQRAMRKTLG